MIQPTPQRAPSAWQEYERRKAALPPTLSPSEYEAALRKICEELGL